MSVTATSVSFPATLGSRERLVTYLVGYGVGIAMPLVLGIAFATAFREIAPLLLPLPFLLIFGGAYAFRPTAFSVNDREISIERPIGTKSVPLAELRAITWPASKPPGFTIGLVRVDGFHGTFGTYWNRAWGRFHVFVTDHRNAVELRLAGGSRIIVSPDDAVAFVRSARSAAARAGVPLQAD